LIYGAVAIKEYVREVLGLDFVRVKLNDLDLDVGWVSGVVTDHYRSMGLFHVPKTQFKALRADIIKNIDINPDIKAEMRKRAGIRAQSRGRFEEKPG